MSKLSQNGSGEEIYVPINPDVMEFVALDEEAQPGYLHDEVWLDLLKDPEFSGLTHGTLVYISRRVPGFDPLALERAEGIKEGVALAVTGMKKTLEALRADRMAGIEEIDASAQIISLPAPANSRKDTIEDIAGGGADIFDLSWRRRLHQRREDRNLARNTRKQTKRAITRSGIALVLPLLLGKNKDVPGQP